MVERGLELNPTRASAISDYRYNDQFANSIGREQLSHQDRLNYDMFRLNREQSLEGVRQGVVQPRILKAKSLPQIESQIVDSADAAGEPIQGYRDMAERISQLSKNLFDVFPKGSLGVRRVEPFREAIPGHHFQRSLQVEEDWVKSQR